MKIDLFDGSIDMRPGSIIRGLMPAILGPDWESYAIVYVKDENKSALKLFSRYKLHNEDGPAVIKTDGTMEWWFNGEKLFVKTQQEFERYMKNKAFW